MINLFVKNEICHKVSFLNPSSSLYKDIWNLQICKKNLGGLKKMLHAVNGNKDIIGQTGFCLFHARQVTVNAFVAEHSYDHNLDKLGPIFVGIISSFVSCCCACCCTCCCAWCSVSSVVLDSSSLEALDWIDAVWFQWYKQRTMNTVKSIFLFKPVKSLVFTLYYNGFEAFYKFTQVARQIKIPQICSNLWTIY